MTSQETLEKVPNWQKATFSSLLYINFPAKTDSALPSSLIWVLLLPHCWLSNCTQRNECFRCPTRKQSWKVAPSCPTLRQQQPLLLDTVTAAVPPSHKILKTSLDCLILLQLITMLLQPSHSTFRHFSSSTGDVLLGNCYKTITVDRILNCLLKVLKDIFMWLQLCSQWKKI